MSKKSRLDSLYRAKALGIDVKKMWSAAMDTRKRISHAMLNGEIRELDEKFSNGLRFPADPNGAGAEVYNCRCTLISVVDGEAPDVTELSQEGRRAGEKQYNAWKAARSGETSFTARKSGNSGAFSVLPERMTKKHIREVFKRVNHARHIFTYLCFKQGTGGTGS